MSFFWVVYTQMKICLIMGLTMSQNNLHDSESTKHITVPFITLHCSTQRLLCCVADCGMLRVVLDLKYAVQSK